MYIHKINNVAKKFIWLMIYFYSFMFMLYISLGLSSFFNSSGENLVGSYTLVILNLILILAGVLKGISNIQKRNWKKILTDEVDYVADKNEQSEKALFKRVPRINFYLKYTADGIIYDRMSSVLQPITNRERILEKLNLKKKMHDLIAVLYYNPKNEEQVVYQKGLSTIGLLLAPVLLFGVIMNTITSIELFSFAKNILQGSMSEGVTSPPGYSDTLFLALQQNPLGLLLIVNILLVLIYVVVVLLEVKLIGVTKLRRYPLFYDKEKETEYDILNELNYQNITCPVCGEEFKKGERNCLKCGAGLQ